MKPCNPRGIKIWDNPEYCDRYTIIIGDCIFAMNDYPFHPAYGFSQYVGDVTDSRYVPGKHWGKRRQFKEMNDSVKEAIMQRIEG